MHRLGEHMLKKTIEFTLGYRKVSLVRDYDDDFIKIYLAQYEISVKRLPLIQHTVDVNGPSEKFSAMADLILENCTPKDQVLDYASTAFILGKLISLINR